MTNDIDRGYHDHEHAPPGPHILPAPLIAREVYVGDKSMPLLTDRLARSLFMRIASNAEVGAALRLWVQAWGERPAGSVPNDRRWLADVTKLGDRWSSHTEVVLRGFVACNDGRLYHPVICEIAKKRFEQLQGRQRGAALITSAPESQTPKSKKKTHERSADEAGRRHHGRKGMSMSTTDIEAGDRRPEKYQLLPELPPEQFEALKADIAKRGVVVPVLMDEFGAILDGHNRARACRELGINDYPIEVRRGLSEPEKRALARNLNALRRHLTREQVRSLIADQLRDTPEWSNQRVAGGLDVDDKTVASVRAGLVATSEIPRLDKTVGADGKARRAPPKRRRKNHSSPLADDELLIDDEDDEADEDEVVALDPTQDKAQRREERERRRADKEWEAIGATAEKRAKFEHAIDLVKMGADPKSEKVVKLMREAAWAPSKARRAVTTHSTMLPRKIEKTGTCSCCSW